MSFITASCASQDHLRYMVRSVAVVKVYYVWTGRNAWWSTWSTRYSVGCFHRTLNSAKDFCEQRRTQGTVFYIDELPSLAFLAPGRALVASEINTDDFFCRLDGKRLTSITTAFPVSTMTLKQMWYLFRVESTLWPTGYPRKNSAFVSFCEDPEPFETVAPDQKLVSYRSSSNGPKYYLGWEERSFNKKRSTLHAVQSVLTSRLDES